MRLSFLSLVVLILFAFSNTSCEKGESPTDLGDEEWLTETEELDLLFIREEEKLARDVYTYLARKYDKLIFKNIARSEQKHMDALLTLIELYDLEDPVSDLEGIFNNEALQTMYHDLIQSGDVSLENAMLVGATIEEQDIRDLNLALENTNRIEIVKVYEKLKCGSENHLRAFDGQLKDLGVVFEPQFIDQDLFDTIISGFHMHCGE